MKKIVLIPDSFKGTMSSRNICDIMKSQIRHYYPDANIISIPVADGGEGTVDCFIEAKGGRRIPLTVKDPLNDDIEAFYGWLDIDDVAIIEMAACAGLPLVEGRCDPLQATTFGVGQLILDAAVKGAKKIIVGLGGSATNDGGCGAASAAGIKFINRNGESFVPTGGSLKEIASIDVSGKHPALENVEIIAMCDIDNPMYGPNGASHIFGPQKGATPEVVELLDEGLMHLDKVIRKDLGIDVSNIPGAGAAGAMGAGMISFFDASLQMGIQTVLDTVDFDKLIIEADMIFTGEGKIDTQSLRGKVVIGVARRAKMADVPVVAIVGDIGDEIESAYVEGVSAIFSINRVAVDFQQARSRSKQDLTLTINNLMRFCARMGL